MYECMCKTCTKSKKKFLFSVSDKNTYDLATYIHLSYGCSEHTHHPVLILEAANNTCCLPINICDKYDNSNQKCLSSRYDSWQILGRSLYLDISFVHCPPTSISKPNKAQKFYFKHQGYFFLRMFRNYADQKLYSSFFQFCNFWTIYGGVSFFLTT